MMVVCRITFAQLESDAMGMRACVHFSIACGCVGWGGCFLFGPNVSGHEKRFVIY